MQKRSLFGRFPVLGEGTTCREEEEEDDDDDDDDEDGNDEISES